MATGAERVGWLYQARRVNTQDNVGGGQLVTRISLASGQMAKIMQIFCQGAAQAAATLYVSVLDEDGATTSQLAAVAAGASRTVYLPSIGSAATASGNVASTVGMLLGPGQYLKFDSSAADQAQTLTVGVVLLLYNVSTAPTWDTTGSAGTPNLAASTISAANTSQAVVVNPP